MLVFALPRTADPTRDTLLLLLLFSSPLLLQVSLASLITLAPRDHITIRRIKRGKTNEGATQIPALTGTSRQGGRRGAAGEETVAETVTGWRSRRSKHGSAWSLVIQKRTQHSITSTPSQLHFLLTPKTVKRSSRGTRSRPGQLGSNWIVCFTAPSTRKPTSTQPLSHRHYADPGTEEDCAGKKKKWSLWIRSWLLQKQGRSKEEEEEEEEEKEEEEEEYQPTASIK
ncbi:hypothetical protein E2C01_003250 [Portunus trituberculatus]|uniref:Uncharacterized protein n=1 Tax=Portunus trituberculatus TaxID=210409 RepID=A0A5B7CT24_PORTR|nr:hypothetical protein [Portunus trituberculatus]